MPNFDALQNNDEPTSTVAQPANNFTATQNHDSEQAAAPGLNRDTSSFRGSKEELVASLRQVSLSIGIDELTPEVYAKIADYCLQLWSWNQNINLTRHTTPDLFVKRDLLDTWHLAKLLEPSEEILDIGTGGGVPGVLVAILRPDVQVNLCDSVAKKANVLQRIVDQLELKIPVLPLSVQKVLEDFRYDTLTARAVGPLPRLCAWLQNDWHNFRRLLAIKGPKWVEERGEARHKGFLKNIELRRVAAYRMPDTQSESTILQLLRPRG
ncbi:MAG: 16S rRNA (guanine(527)-N(7))-methyltransferase RsmG [Pirellula sp.]